MGWFLKLLLLIIVAIVVLFFLGYQFNIDFGFSLSSETEQQNQTAIATPPVPEQVAVPEPLPEPLSIACTSNLNCSNGQLCIDQQCSTLAEQYESENCTATCKVTSVNLTTSDNQNFSLNMGSGSYSYAGALEWKLMGTPEYCPTEQPLVPIKLIKKNYGKILEEEIVTVKKGETSAEITHPVIPDVRFTLTLMQVGEECES